MVQPMVSVFPWPQLLPLKMAASEGAAKPQKRRVGTEVRRDWLMGLNLLLPCVGSLASIPAVVAGLSANPSLSIVVVLFWVAHLTLFLRVQKLQREVAALRRNLDETCTVGARLLALRKQAK